MLVVPLNTAAWGDPVAISTIVAGDTAVLTLAAAGIAWLRRWSRPQARRRAAELADELAEIVDEELRGEGFNRGLRDPAGPIPLSWDGGGIGHERDFDRVTRLLADRFRGLALPRLLILGEPGSGKTSLALMLAIGLKASRQPGQATPVMLSLSDWDPVALPRLDDFIVQAVARRYYGGAVAVPARLLAEGLILPILDGLDELPEPERTMAVTQLNLAIGNSARQLVVTCRQEDYNQIITHGGEPLRRTARVPVKPLEPNEIVACLIGTGAAAQMKWQDVAAKLLSGDSPKLAGALSTPLMISLARSVYAEDGADPNELIAPDGFRSRQAIEDHLAGKAISCAYGDDGTRPPGSANQAAQRLTTLARALRQHASKDIAWWRLHDQLLPRWSVVVIGVAFGLALLALCLGIGAFLFESQLPGLSTVLFPLGAVLGAVFAAGVFVVWFVAPQPEPVQLVFQLDGSLARIGKGFLAGFRVGLPLSALILLYKVASTSITDRGWNPTAVIGFSQWFVACALLPLVLGVALAGRSWISAAPKRAMPAGPKPNLRKDRSAAVVGFVVTAAAVALTATPAWIAATILGELLGNVLTDWPGFPGEPSPGIVVDGTLFRLRGWLGNPGILTAAELLPAFIVGSLVLLTYAWPRFTVTRIAAPLRGLPRNIMGFLSDAQERRVLRQFGNVYQFRHVRVLELLIRSADDPRFARPTTRRKVIRRAALVSVLALTAGLVVAFPLLVSRDTALAIATGNVVDARWAPSGRTLVTASRFSSRQYEIRRWSATSGRLIGEPMPAVAWALDPVTGVLATASGANSEQGANVDLWDENGGHMRTLGPVTDLEFSPRGTTFATYDEKARSVRLWNENTGPLGVPQLRNVVAAAFSPGGSAFVTVDADTFALHMLDPATGKVIERLTETPAASTYEDMRGRSLVAPVADYQLRTWPNVLPAPTTPPAAIVFPGEGTMHGTLELGATNLAAMEVTDSQAAPYSADHVPTDLLLWDLTAGAISDGTLERVQEWKFDSQGTLAVRLDLRTNQDSDGSLRNTYSYVLRHTGQRLPVLAVEGFSEDLPVVEDRIFVYGNEQGSRRILDGNTGDQVGADTDAGTLILPSKGCCFALQADDEHIRVGNIATGRPISTIRPPQPTLPFFGSKLGAFGDVAFSPDGRSLVTVQLGRGIALWHLPEVQMLRNVDGGESWQFVGGGDLLAIATTKFSIELYNAATGRPVSTLTGHTGPIHSIWASPDRAKLATTSDDGTVRIWQIPS